MSFVISFDPGSNKCGLVLANIESNQVLKGKVVSKDSVLRIIRIWADKYDVKTLILGDGTSSTYWHKILSKDNSFSIKLVKEANTTFRARYRYFELWPRSFFLKLVPLSLILPPKNLDAVAALIILEDYTKNKFHWQIKPDFRILP